MSVYDWDEFDERAAAVPRPGRPTRGGAAGVLAAAMLGLADVLDPPTREEPVIEVEADEPEDDLPVDVELHDDPRQSVARIRDAGW